MKYWILICFAISIGHIYAEDNEDNSYNITSLYINYSRVSTIIPGYSFISTGYRHHHHNFDVDVDFLDVGTGARLYASTGFSFSAFSIFQIGFGYIFTIPYNVTQYELIEHIGYTKIGLQFGDALLRNQTDVGIKSRFYLQGRAGLQSLFMMSNTTTLKYLLVQMEDIFSWHLAAGFTYDYSVKHQESLYQAQVETVLLQNHIYGELGLRLLFSYADAIGDISVLRRQRNFLSLTTTSMANASIPFYNIAAAAQSEYRFFFLKFLRTYKWYEDFYLAASYIVAYLGNNTRGTLDSSTVYNLKHYFGVGIGFKIFGSFPMTLRVVFDEDRNIGFTIVSSILPLF